MTAKSGLQVLKKLVQETESWSQQRRVILRIGVDFGLRTRITCNPADIKQAHALMWKLDTLTTLWQTVRQQCSTDLLYWVRELLSPMLQSLVAHPQTVSCTNTWQTCTQT